jgi:Lrp/AsnC family transcriptional regulator
LNISDDLDVFERRILVLLQKDAARSTAEIAAEVGLSEAPCWRRIQKLKSKGYIRKQVALVDKEKVGASLQVFVQIKLDAVGRANINAFAERIREFPEVMECFILLGNFDFLLRIVTRSIADYERFFFDRLSSVSGIKDANSIVTISEVKSTTEVPIPAE